MATGATSALTAILRCNRSYHITYPGCGASQQIKAVASSYLPPQLSTSQVPRQRRSETTENTEGSSRRRWLLHRHRRTSIIKIKIHSSCEIEYFVEIHLCKPCVILRSRVLRVVCSHEGFFFLHTFTFQLLDKPWSKVSTSLLLAGSCHQFLSRIGFSNPTARRLFIECC